MTLESDPVKTPSPPHGGPIDGRPRVAPRLERFGIWGAFLCLFVALAVLGYRQRSHSRPDDFAYVQCAQHYARGEFSLAITGYWGPLVCWLMAPLMHVMANPFHAGRVVMGLAAVVFVVGCLAVWWRMRLPAPCMVLGTCVVSLAVACWSVQAIGPDTLVAGFLLLGISGLMAPGWTRGPLVPIATGSTFGVAYLAKAVALPVSVLFTTSVALLVWRIRLASPGSVLRAWLLTLAVVGLVAAPWAVILSRKYGRPLFSTSALINHALVGPGNTDWSRPGYRWIHPGVIGRPARGRLFPQEDPPLANYTPWSPLESRAHLIHQLRIIKKSSAFILEFLLRSDVLRLGCAGLILGLLVHQPWARDMRSAPWRWSGIFVACLSIIYLPVYSGAGRYYWLAYPLQLGAAFGLVDSLASRAGRGRGIPRILGLSIIMASFLTVTWSDLKDAASEHPERSIEPWMAVARTLQVTHEEGPVISDRHCLTYALTICMFTESPLYGYFHQGPFGGANVPGPPRLEDFLDVGAKYVIVERGSEYDEKLAGDRRFEEAGGLLPEGPGMPGDFRIYRVRAAGGAVAAR